MGVTDSKLAFILLVPPALSNDAEERSNAVELSNVVTVGEVRSSDNSVVEITVLLSEIVELLLPLPTPLYGFQRNK